MGAVDPKSIFQLNLQMNETHILIRLLRMYIPWNWEFGSDLAKLQNFGEEGGGLNPSNRPHSVRHCIMLVILTDMVGSNTLSTATLWQTAAM
jgi:hypothetical protein